MILRTFLIDLRCMLLQSVLADLEKHQTLAFMFYLFCFCFDCGLTSR